MNQAPDLAPYEALTTAKALGCLDRMGTKFTAELMWVWGTGEPDPHPAVGYVVSVNPARGSFTVSAEAVKQASALNAAEAELVSRWRGRGR